MFVYHFAFDLRFYGVTRADFEHDPFWLSFRALDRRRRSWRWSA